MRLRRLPRLRPSTLALAGVGIGLAMLAVTLFIAENGRLTCCKGLQESQDLTRYLGLTDPALLTGSSYGRHLTLVPAQAAFQSHPMAFDPFPGGSLVPPPAP